MPSLGYLVFRQNRIYTHGTMPRVVLFVAIFCFGLLGCKGGGVAGKYFMNVQPQAQSAMPGADKIILTLGADGKFDVSAGPVSLLSGDWKQSGDHVTFSASQGLIGTDYQVSADKLIPQLDGKPVSGWDFTRK